ncbi:MAG: hypothetical protein JST16_11115 [Bdellovibrionales bacterium]|nr:hypothetical protein [Bdellovibrionales bacterium]
MVFSVSRLLGVSGFLLSLWAASPARATGLSANLSASDIRYAADILLYGSQHRGFSAPSVPNDNLGLDLGVESTFLFRRDILDGGDQSAVVPRIIPLPRLWGMWDLPGAFQVSGSFSPGALYDGVSTVGAGVQWTFYRNSEYGVAVSVLGDYTYVDAFGDLSGHLLGGSAQVSRDLDMWQPYVGGGFAAGGASVRGELVAPGVDRGTYSDPKLHFYFGTRIDFAAKLYVQLDFYNAFFTSSILMATSF